MIESPQFRRLIQAANPLAEALLWCNHQSLRDSIIAEYHAYVPAVAEHLSAAQSLIHVSFDNWTSTGGQYGMTGICVHHLDGEGELQDYLLGLPELHGAHSGANIASRVATVLRAFGMDGRRLGYFVLDNALNNDTAMVTLASEFGFDPAYRRLRCCAHILNLGAQAVIWGRDREAFENNRTSLGDEEKFIEEWRKFGPISVLFDIIASICTPQARQLFEQLQRDEATTYSTPTDEVEILQLVKPVRTRWNSYYQTFVRAVRLHGPIDSYVELKLEEHCRANALTKRKRGRNSASDQQSSLMSQQQRLYICEGGLSSKDWATISEYINLLEPFYEATKLIEGRGKHGSYGAIWEVLITFEWLLDQLEQLKDRLRDVDFDNADAPEDHLMININAAHTKILEYYAKFDDAPVYYAATILHPHYKHHLEALWKVPETHNSKRDGLHSRDGWLAVNHKAFLAMWQARKDAAVVAAGAPTTPPLKKPRVGLSASRSAFLQSSIELATKQLEAIRDDEFEVWRRQPILSEEDPLSLNPVRYWQLHVKQYPVLSKFAINIMTILAAAADCERQFSELGDMLGTRRLQMKAELIAALQSLKSWKRIGIKPLATSSSRIVKGLSEAEIMAI